MQFKNCIFILLLEILENLGRNFSSLEMKNVKKTETLIRRQTNKLTYFLITENRSNIYIVIHSWGIYVQNYIYEPISQRKWIVKRVSDCSISLPLDCSGGCWGGCCPLPLPGWGCPRPPLLLCCASNWPG